MLPPTFEAVNKLVTLYTCNNVIEKFLHATFAHPWCLLLLQLSLVGWIYDLKFEINIH